MGGDGTRDRIIAKALIEARSGVAARPQPNESVAPVSAGFEVRDECPTNSCAAPVRSDIEMAQAPDPGILDIRVRRYPAHGNQFIVTGHAQKKLARVVEPHSSGGQIADEPLDEGEPLGLAERGQFPQRSKVPNRQWARRYHRATEERVAT